MWREGVGVGACDHNVEFALVLTDVGGISDGDGRAVESALNAGYGAGVGAVDAVKVEGWVALEVCKTILAFAICFDGGRWGKGTYRC